MERKEFKKFNEICRVGSDGQSGNGHPASAHGCYYFGLYIKRYADNFRYLRHRLPSIQ